MTKIKEPLKNYFNLHSLEKFLVFLALSFATVSLVSCKTPTRQEIDATIWLNNTKAIVPLCATTPALKDIGFYRKLDTGKLEFISFCSPLAQNMLSVTSKDFNAMLDKYLPEPDPGQ